MKSFKLITIYTFAFFYINVGLFHFLEPDFFHVIIPSYFPFKLFFVYLSGFFEILFGSMILIKKTRYFASIGICILLVFIFPANIYLYNSYEAQEILNITKQGAFIRLFFQIPLIILAYWHSLTKSSEKFDIICALIFFPTIFYFLTL